MNQKCGIHHYKNGDNVPTNTLATSKVTFNFEFSNWHNGESMDMNDILHSLYFTMEWGIQTDENDKTFDTEFTPRAAQSIQTIIAVNQLDERYSRGVCELLAL